MRFNELSELWLESKKQYIKFSTYALYVYEVRNYLQKEFGSYKLGELNEKLLQNKIIELQNEKIASSTLINIITLLKQILKYAQKKNYIKNKELNFGIRKNNQFSSIKYDNIEHRLTISDQDLKHLMNILNSKINFKTFGIMLAIYEGLRIGEICALKWKDFDFENNIIYITKTLQRIYLPKATDEKKSKIIITTAKTKSSIRIIPISNEIKKIIEKLTSKNMLYLNLTQSENYIITNSKHFMEPRCLRRYYTQICRQNNIKGLKFHNLRHTFATKCIEQGTDCKIVSELLGHSTVNTTLNLYVHPSMKDKRLCLDKLKF